MKRWFPIGVALLVPVELANVYFIMPLPYSQRVRSIDLAYALYRARWVIRAIALVMIAVGAREVWRAAGWRRAAGVVALIVAGAVTYMTNFKMAADHIFIAPQTVTMRPSSASVVAPARLVVGVVVNDEARAYPVQFIGYHHQVRDSVAGTPVLVSFCTVCRTGRVFSPVIDGRAERFRLVGMDHFNAMFEDATTGSWWRQATGEAVAGPRKGQTLKELPSQQMTLARWLELHPKSLIMQPDSSLAAKYTKSFDYETGVSRSALTGTDTASWHEKSWVVGVAQRGESKAYDWNRLRREGVINDAVGGVPVVLALGSDGVNFFVSERPDSVTRFELRNDSLVAPGRSYTITGWSSNGALKPVAASQEFWHSWRSFHPGTKTY
jgi:uncharacterized protein DUF3179